MSPENKSDKSLVIVESPAKARTLNRYLGSGYSVKASMGHVKDLPEKELGVGSLYEGRNMDIPHYLDNALKAHNLYRKARIEFYRCLRDAVAFHARPGADLDAECRRLLASLER